jgi:hypothetical protein
MESLTEEMINSNNELIQLIKYHVDRKLYEFYKNLEIQLSYELRDICVIKIYGVLEKKYFNDTNFNIKKEKIIKNLINTLITKEYLENN